MRKNQVSSFPLPSDLFYEGELALPVKFKDGFLSYTYEAYSKLVKELNQKIEKGLE
jgi:hypothetical protein